MGPFWYAQYNKSDKVVVAAGYVVDPQVFVDADHDVTVGFEGSIPTIKTQGANPGEWTYLWKYNTETQKLEANS